MAKSVKKSFMQGAMILIVANLIVKVIGAVYDIPLANIIGEQGKGYYGVAYSLYGLLFVLSTAGLPVAISKMVSESYALGKYSEVKKIVKVAFCTFLILGLAGSAAMILGADAFAKSVRNDLAVQSIIMIAPAVFFVAIMSAFRGYFQGLQNMVPTAISQVIEALCKLVVGLGSATMLISLGKDMPTVAAGAVFGVTVGTAMGALALFIIYMKSSSRRNLRKMKDTATVKARTSKEIFKYLIWFAVPVTIGASVMSLTNVIDTFLVMTRLGDIGYSQFDANGMYGAYTVAQKLFNLPASLIFTIGISVMPVLSAAFASRNYIETKKTMESALRICSLLAIPSGVGLMVLARPVMNLLYFAQPNLVEVGAPLLARLGMATTFVCIVSLTNAMLQAVGLVNIPVFTMFIGGVVKFIGDYFLIGIPSVNIGGAPIATTMCYATIMILNIIFIVRKVEIVPDFMSIFVKPLIAATAMGIVAVTTYDLTFAMVGSKIATVVAIGFAILVYFGVLVAIKGFIKEDVLLLPKGKKIAALLEKKGLLKR